MPNKTLLIIACASMFIAIVLGAMAAHYLKGTLKLPDYKLDSWKTAVFYQIVNSLSIIILFILAHIMKTSFNVESAFLLVGFILFSFSIYILTLNHIWQIDVLNKIMGPITPLGGLVMLLGWVLLVVKLFKLKGL
jgi:uncharacterized membrane protein YgdD (TMEM256/DUF423 family)